ncbi:uncharacterized protein HD556DRAFT_1539053 [Suillus plorans]|uniref:HMG box domain-containing protein n=1 Tax=Suillus plorans TaxID=116603 RepID=A0A9P7DCU5_9AGAM|nr:uncharacterized protein HD556DRAFT_1539053 [Suillus plorans]KAG1787662.1 hypothetical protein HD556DRAFT_1539053 [Suillus plorans]KAG1811550.1 hypothetical protein EV424DRAFT_1420719 [Suillus variegatus]KAG2056133.1 HMG-box [Suillus hirtellus]
MPPKEPKEELDLDQKKAQLAIKFNNAARQFSALAEVLSKAVAEVPIDESTVNNLTELLNAAITKPSRKRKLVALEIGEDGVPRKKKREKKIKDPNAPKGPASAYILFQNDIRSAYKKEHPDMSNKELLRLIGDQWKTLADDKKDFYRDQHGRAKKKHEVDLAAYNAQHPDQVPTEAKDSGKKKKKDDEESDHPATKEVAKAAPKTAKKAAAPKVGKVVPKSKEVVESSGSEAEDASEVEASDAESSDDEPAPKAKAKATTDEDSESDSEVDTSSEEEVPPPPPPAKKSKK